MARASSQAQAVPLGGTERITTITDATSATAIQLAPPGNTTTLAFPVDIAAQKVLLVDPRERVFPPMAQGSTLVLVAKEPLPAGTTVPLTVTLVDGTQLNFGLTSTATSQHDRFVRVELALVQRAGADNTARLKAQLEETQGRLDECLEAGPDEGVRKLGAIILAQDLGKPETFTVEKRAYRGGIDKQSRLLVETHYVLRLFELTYLVLTVENRDPARPWVLERVELALEGGGGAKTDARVTGVEQQLPAIRPGETSKLVVAFRMPPRETAERFTLRLVEKGGSRHVELDGLHL